VPRRNRVARAAALRAAREAEMAVPTPAVVRRTPPETSAMELWAPTVARVALGLVLLWFGLHELLQPSLWTGYVPVIAGSSKFAIALVLLHGWALVVMAVALTLGIAPRVAAAVSALMLLEIVVSLSVTGGLSDIVARDLGVFGLAVAVFANDKPGLALRD